MSKRYEWSACNAEAIVAALSMKFHFSMDEAADYLNGLGVLKEIKPQQMAEEAAAEAAAAERVSRRHKSCAPPPPQQQQHEKKAMVSSQLSSRHLSLGGAGPELPQLSQLRGVRTGSNAADEFSRTGFEVDAEDWRLVEGAGADGKSSYYWNERTQETCWEKPECLALAEKSADMNASAAMAAKMMGLTHSARDVLKSAAVAGGGQGPGGAGPGGAGPGGAGPGGAGKKKAGRGNALGKSVQTAEAQRLRQVQSTTAHANPFAKSNYVPSGSPGPASGGGKHLLATSLDAD
jgi:hypothetical protein